MKMKRGTGNVSDLAKVTLLVSSRGRIQPRSGWGREPSPSLCRGERRGDRGRVMRRPQPGTAGALLDGDAEAEKARGKKH